MYSLTFQNCFGRKPVYLSVNMKHSKILITALLLYSGMAGAQCVAPYFDLTNQFYAFDNGQGHFLEPVMPTSYKAGKNYLAFINGNNSRLRLYYADKVYTVCENAADYWATDNWFVWKNYGLLGVLYNNELKPLDKMVLGEYWVGDSIIAWMTTFNELKVFYNGEMRSIEAFPIQQKPTPDGASNFSNARIGPNIFAYVDASGQFKAFYNGNIVNIEGYEPVMFKVDRDFIVYIDNSNNFKFFYKGQSYETNLNNIRQYWTGEGFFAYYSLQRELMVWYNGEEHVVAQDRAKEIAVDKNVIAYTDKSSNFFVWYKGKTELLERFQPLSVKTYRNLVVYQDLDGRLKGYYYGKQIQISDQIVTTYNVYNETVVYSLQRGETNFWCDGKTTTLQY
ncbi:MAG: hypothetical protein JWO03_1430 [Bacteroidetes bacterium]|nr:hypothetical protein [Bacteroidota bacterium]